MARYSKNGIPCVEEIQGTSQASHVPKPRKNKQKSISEARPVILALPVPTVPRKATGNKPVARGETTRQRLKNKLANKEPVGNKVVVQEPETRASAQKNSSSENIEFLSQDSGLRGCWFRCKILHSAQKCLKVQHCDVLYLDGPQKLEEWVPKDRVAAPDQLGMRCLGRLMVRPWPHSDSSELKIEVGTAVDAWWCDGWWEGVVVECDKSSKSSPKIFFPGEKLFRNVERKDIRVSRDWVDNQWVDVKAKPDINSFLNSYLNPQPQVKPNLGNSKVPGSSQVGGAGDGKLLVPSSSNSKASKKRVTFALKAGAMVKEKEAAA